MSEKTLVRRSKLLSLILRHNPGAAGLTLEEGGWVSVDALLEGVARMGKPMTRDQLDEVVAKNDKKRFGFSECGTKIRASQGHSVKVELNLKAATPPAELLHGTADRNKDAILAQGLRPMKRQHVHLSIDRETAVKVAQRHGKPVIFTVDTASMIADGHHFYLADNGVWLSDAVAPKYLSLTQAP